MMPHSYTRAHVRSRRGPAGPRHVSDSTNDLHLTYTGKAMIAPVPLEALEAIVLDRAADHAAVRPRLGGVVS